MQEREAFRTRRGALPRSLKSAVSRLRSAEVAGARKSSISKDANQALISYRETMKYPNELGLYEFVENFILRKICMTKSDES